MKRIFALLFLTVASFGLSFGQSNSTGGSNFYVTSDLFGKTFSELTSTRISALVYVDYAHGDDGVVSALVELGYNVTVASDGADFTYKLANNTYSLVVLFNQNFYTTNFGVSVSTIRDYIQKGGRIIFATWCIYQAEPWVNLFEAHLTGGVNQPSMTITDPILAADITNPVTLSNHSWGIYNVGLSAIGGGKVLATYPNGQAAMISGHGGRTLILGYLSDAPDGLPVKQSLVTNASWSVTKYASVPIPYVWVIAVFLLIAFGIVFTKRKAIFSHN
jgi:hypothetical protein